MQHYSHFTIFSVHFCFLFPNFLFLKSIPFYLYQMYLKYVYIRRPPKHQPYYNVDVYKIYSFCIYLAFNQKLHSIVLFTSHTHTHRTKNRQLARAAKCPTRIFDMFSLLLADVNILYGCNFFYRSILYLMKSVYVRECERLKDGRKCVD